MDIEKLRLTVEEINKLPVNSLSGLPTSVSVADAQLTKVLAYIEQAKKEERERLLGLLGGISYYVGSYDETIDSKRAISLRGSGLYFDFDRFEHALEEAK